MKLALKKIRWVDLKLMEWDIYLQMCLINRISFEYKHDISVKRSNVFDKKVLENINMHKP